MTRRLCSFLFSVVAVMGLCVFGVLAEGRDASLYVGTKMCKMCHKKEATGNQYAKWQAAVHSKAYANLASEEARAVAEKVGVDDPQKSPKCLKCHSTAYSFTESVVTAKVSVEDGVSCESCHGPGKKYKSKTVMQDRKLCIEKGMVYPATASCVLCHNDASPTWKADRYTDDDGVKVGFDVKKAYEKIKHPNPRAAE